MNWQAFSEESPYLAEFGLERFKKHRVVLLSTIRKDGTPRLSPLEVPLLFEGGMYMGMMWRSTKALDLLRDPRCLLHNAVTNPDGGDQEFKLRGRATEVQDPDRLDGIWASIAAAMGFPRPEQAHMFELDIESAAAVKVEDSKMWVRSWPGTDEWRVRED